MGRQFLQQRQNLTLPRPRQADAAEDSPEGRSGRNGSTSVSAGVSAAALTDYDEAMFEELRALRKRLADVQDVPAFVIFGDVSLRHMAALFPQSLESFSRIPGVGAAKLEKYGGPFLEVIRSYADANGLQDQTTALPGRERPRARDRDREGKREQPERRRRTTYDDTKELLSQKLTVSQIAQQRNLAEPTIIGHLERMAAQGETLELEHLLPAAARLEKIKAAFDVCGSDFLAPVREFLGRDYTYDELRLARLYLSQDQSPAD